MSRSMQAHAAAAHVPCCKPQPKSLQAVNFPTSAHQHTALALTAFVSHPQTSTWNISHVQVECPAVTPEVVLRASGHVERFTDLMVTDMVTGDCHRADHLLEHALEALLEDTAKPLPADKRKVSCSCGGSGVEVEDAC